MLCVLSVFMYICMYLKRIIAVLPVDSIVVKPQSYIVHVILSHNQKPHLGCFKGVAQNLKCKNNGHIPKI